MRASSLQYISPIFIVGVHRSGTTLLRFMLSSHSRIYIPPESDFIPYFFSKDPHTKLSNKQIKEYLRIIFTRYRFVEDWEGDPPDLDNFIQMMQDRTPASFLDTLYKMYAFQNNAIRWGDKTPIYSSYLPLLHEIFPQALFIHIIRDPYDAAISLLDKYENNEFHIDIYFAAHNWVRRIKEARSSRTIIGENQYYELFYENLVHDPQKEISGICNFIGENYESNMVEHHKLANKTITPDSYFFAKVREPINISSIGRGRARLSDQDKRLIEYIAAELMNDLGYPVADGRKLDSKEMRRLVCLKIKYNTLQWGRKIFTKTGLLPPI